ncbi:hypothetical protein LEP1GSC058_3603 [Leptospira fainei serovar Hurstbridge str. BUT 6]|uniref:START domain-containing protein n=1 Tax=Leptospira fainei serovar Hurstbridge str. BUT 6 TaxID=1193011 RepID=S3VAD8_9LEPT|nr:START domain-containing protein [Leptospira fainei]EPG73420.1 hypothetical protein LEP1GSC058_3603 [Leptospira fainei serovar Hurstbridge str. BUT 6]
MRQIYRILLVFSILSGSSIFAEDWVYVKEEQSVKIYKKTMETSFDAFKVSTLISRPLFEVRNIFLNIPGHIDWIANCKESKVLGGKVPEKFRHYYLIAAPWPVKDREMVLETESHFDPKNKRFHIFTKALNDLTIPAKKNAFRIVNSRIQWILEEISPSSTLVTYINQTDPGGDVPAYISNWSSSDAPIETILGLKKIIEK